MEESGPKFGGRKKFGFSWLNPNFEKKSVSARFVNFGQKKGSAGTHRRNSHFVVRDFMNHSENYTENYQDFS